MKAAPRQGHMLPAPSPPSSLAAGMRRLLRPPLPAGAVAAAARVSEAQFGAGGQQLAYNLARTSSLATSEASSDAGAASSLLFTMDPGGGGGNVPSETVRRVGARHARVGWRLRPEGCVTVAAD